MGFRLLQRGRIAPARWDLERVDKEAKHDRGVRRVWVHWVYFQVLCQQPRHKARIAQRDSSPRNRLSFQRKHQVPELTSEGFDCRSWKYDAAEREKIDQYHRNPSYRNQKDQIGWKIEEVCLQHRRYLRLLRCEEPDHFEGVRKLRIRQILGQKWKGLRIGSLPHVPLPSTFLRERQRINETIPVEPNKRRRGHPKED